MQDLRIVTKSTTLRLPQVVPWFPNTIRDIDNFSTKTLDAGAELEADHPGFHDGEYRERRRKIVEAAATYKYGERQRERRRRWGGRGVILRIYCGTM